MTTTKIFGGAGCGKTYYLTQEMLKTSKTTPLSEICMMTLTRSARREFVGRSQEVTGVKDMESLKWFGTMHHIAWALLGNTSKQIAQPKDIKGFYESLNRPEETSRFKKMESLDVKRRECILPLTKDGFKETMRLTGSDLTYKCNISGQWEHMGITLSDCVKFGTQWEGFLDDGDFMDYTESVSRLILLMEYGVIQLPFSKLFIDEFQDFTPLQHQLYVEMSKHVDDVWFCGDDRQVIYRYAGASPRFLLNDPTDREIILPKTYRYGASILKNSMKYIKRLSEQKDRNIEPADHDSHVYKLHGDQWIDKINPDDPTVFLCRTNKMAYEVSRYLDGKGLIYGYLGKNKSESEKLGDLYNSLYRLKSGGEISKESARALLKQMPSKLASFAQRDLTGGLVNPVKTQFLQRGIPTKVKKPQFLKDARLSYDIDEFGADFMAGGVLNLSKTRIAIRGMEDFTKHMNLDFSCEMGEIKHHVGTIHKFKGNQIDNVFLFMQLPYPMSGNVKKSKAAREDEMRAFYVGATRARKNLYEVSDFFKDRRMRPIMSVEDIL